MSTTIQSIIERNVGMSAMEFLHPEERPYIYGIKEAVEYILKHKNDPITIVGDFDCDGICSTAILYHGLLRSGIMAKTRLPHRFSEGYGLSEKIIDEIDSGIVITVDNGIAAHQAIDKAKAKGLKVIVTDHHLPKETLPSADILIDPNAEEKSAYKNYCGAGIAYRLVEELTGKEEPDLLILASIATVADVMKLVGTNRSLVKKGLSLINEGEGVIGLRRILEKIQLIDHINEDDYGFKLGPIFNASGRLYDDGSERVLEVLKATKSSMKLDMQVEELIKNNETRKTLVKKLLPVAEKLAKGSRPIVVYHPSFGAGIIGILAGQLTEKYQCPTIVFTKDDNGNLKGSGRAPVGFHLKNILDSISEKMMKYGGHEGAAGLTIPSGTLEEFRSAFIEACGDMPEIRENCEYDLDLHPSTLHKTLTQLKIFAPYGEGNPKPVFHIRYNGKGEYARMGDGSHFRIKGKTITLLGFDLAKKYEDMGMPSDIDCIGYPKEHVFNGVTYYQFEMKGFEMHDCSTNS